MNKQYLLAAIVFVGLCTVLLGAPGEPNPALKSVAHDATLLGEGTTSSPLGVANPVGGRVVDSLGHLVGPFFLPNFAVRQIGEETLAIPVGTNGFRRTVFTFFYVSSDCSGTRYLAEEPDRLVRDSLVAGSRLFYSPAPQQLLTFRSGEVIRPPADPNQPSPCTTFAGPEMFTASPARSIDLALLGLTPPFHLEF
jgi:hypothetical protein